MITRMRVPDIHWSEERGLRRRRDRRHDAAEPRVSGHLPADAELWGRLSPCLRLAG